MRGAFGGLGAGEPLRFPALFGADGEDVSMVDDGEFGAVRRDGEVLPMGERV